MTRESAKRLELLVEAAKLYGDKLIDADKRRYFNTSTGASVNVVVSALSTLQTDLMHPTGEWRDHAERTVARALGEAENLGDKEEDLVGLFRNVVAEWKREFDITVEDEPGAPAP